MARNAKDVELECGQFLDKLERQYERAEDRQRRSKTTSATTTARMGAEPEPQTQAPRARDEATVVAEKPVQKRPAQQAEQPAAGGLKEEAPQDAAVDVQETAAGPDEPVEPAEAEAEQPAEEQEEPSGDEEYGDGEYEDYDETGEEEEGPDFAQAVKEKVLRAGEFCSALGGKILSGSHRLLSRLRREDSIEEEDFDEYGETPASEDAAGEAGPAETPEEADAAELTEAPEPQQMPEEEVVPEALDAPEPADAVELPETPEPADAVEPADSPEPEAPEAAGAPEESFEEEAPRRSGLKSLFARRGKAAEQPDDEDGEDDEEYADDEEDGDETDEYGDEEEEEEESASSGFGSRLRSLFGRRKKEADEEEFDAGEQVDEEEADEDGGEETAEDGQTASEPDASDRKQDKERTMNMEDNQKSLSELLAEGMSDTPSLSRRERRALNAAGESDKKSAAKEVADDLEMDLSENPVEEEPTLEFHPVHKREEEKRAPLRKPSRKALDELDYEDEDDEDDEEEEEEVKPVRRKEKKKDKKRYEDDEDDEYDDEYDDDYDDDDEDEDDEEEVSFLKRLLGFFKGLLAVALIVLLVVFVLRLLEAGGRISLDWLRSGVGERLPFVNSVFPKP